MTYSKDFGTLNLIGCYLVNGDPVQAKTQEVSKITHFVDNVDEPKVSIDLTKRYLLVSPNGKSMPTSIGIQTKKGTKYTYNQNGYFIEAQLKKMVGTMTYTRGVTK